jgi:hypothetical protein
MLFFEMPAATRGVELAREMIALVFVAVWMLALLWVQRRH